VKSVKTRLNLNYLGRYKIELKENMMKRFTIRRLLIAIVTTGFLGLANQATASAFQLWEQSASSVANYHAGYAASVDDASTSFYNPAGLTFFHNQQIELGGVTILTDFKFNGNVTVNTIGGGKTPLPAIAQGGIFAFVPDLNYVAPITDNLAFGFSVVIPFGLKTDYGDDTPLRYIATSTSVTVIDISPAFAYRIKRLSLGAGLDIQRMMGEFDSVGTLGGELDGRSTNSADDTAYGYHLGVLYAFTPETRVGISYHSQVVHHLTGTSKFVGPLVQDFTPMQNYIVANRAKVNVTLPPYTALSAYHRFTAPFAVMGSVIFTQWDVFHALTLQNAAGIADDFTPSNTLVVSIPEHYKNTWNFSLGADYFATSQFTLRGAIGYDQSPVSNDFRNVQLPDNNRYVFALGGHYQASSAVGVDLGWTHFFFHDSLINPPPQVTGAQIATSTGHVTGGADVFGAQVDWDIA
jgi:long-chain fatty acid transport protein